MTDEQKKILTLTVDGLKFQVAALNGAPLGELFDRLDAIQTKILRVRELIDAT